LNFNSYGSSTSIYIKLERRMAKMEKKVVNENKSEKSEK